MRTWWRKDNTSMSKMLQFSVHNHCLKRCINGWNIKITLSGRSFQKGDGWLYLPRQEKTRMPSLGCTLHNKSDVSRCPNFYYFKLELWNPRLSACRRAGSNPLSYSVFSKRFRSSALSSRLKSLPTFDFGSMSRNSIYCGTL